MPTATGPLTRRIAVALDASAASRAALQAAADLAALLEARLEGIFLEDINLLRTAELPFLREVRLTSLAAERVSQVRLEQELRVTAMQLREALEQAAAERGVVATFTVRRGRIENELGRLAMEVDVLSISRPLAGMGERIRPTSRPTTTRDSGAVTAAPVTVACSGRCPPERTVTAAARLALRQQAPLLVLAPEPDNDLRRYIDRELDKLPGGSDLAVNYRAMQGKAIDGLIRQVGVAGSRVLLIDVNDPLLAGEALWRQRAALSCPVLLVR